MNEAEASSWQFMNDLTSVLEQEVKGSHQQHKSIGSPLYILPKQKS